MLNHERPGVTLAHGFALVALLAAAPGCGADDSDKASPPALPGQAEGAGGNGNGDGNGNSTVSGGSTTGGSFTAGTGAGTIGGALPAGVGGSAAAVDSAVASATTGLGSTATSGTSGGNTNVALGGSQDFGYFRALLAQGTVPSPDDFDAAGFFAEHHPVLPDPVCGERVCLQPMLAVMGNLTNGNNCTMLQLGLNSPIVADANNRPALNLTVVVDVSGSMEAAGKIDFVRDGLELMIDGMRDGDKFGLVTYSDSAEVRFPMQEVALNRASIREIVQSLAAVGGTNLYGGLEAGYGEAQTHYEAARQNRVIVLSDGQPTVGITDNASILDMSKAYNSDGIGLTSIGLGTAFNAELMRNLALQADGNFYFLEDSGAVSEVFSEELSYFTVPVAFNLELSLTAGADYDFGDAYGSPFWQDTETGGSLSVPSVFLAHRESADDITDEGGRRGGGSALLIELMPKVFEDDGSGASAADVATIDIAFDDPVAGARVTDQITVDYPNAPWVLEPTGYFRADDIAVVQKSFVMLNLYVGIEQACRMYHEFGETLENVSSLRRLLAAVRDYNEEVQDPDIEFDIALVEDLISVLEQLGQPVPEPEFPADPWPAD